MKCKVNNTTGKYIIYSKCIGVDHKETEQDVIDRLKILEFNSLIRQLSLDENNDTSKPSMLYETALASFADAPVPADHRRKQNDIIRRNRAVRQAKSEHAVNPHDGQMPSEPCTQCGSMNIARQSQQSHIALKKSDAQQAKNRTTAILQTQPQPQMPLYQV